jgi:hypothetical protein
MFLEILLEPRPTATTTTTTTYITPVPGAEYQGIVLPGGLAFAWNSAVTITILAIVALIETLKLLGRVQRLEAALADILKEIAVLFTVVFFIMNLWQFVPVSAAQPKEVINKLQLVVDEAYERTVKMEQCVANIRLSGPAGAYAGYAEAKFSKYKSLYEQAIWMYNQLSGLARHLAEYGPTILAAGMLIYAAWLRKVGGVIIGIFTGLWVGLALLAGAVQIIPAAVNKVGVWGEDFHPFLDIGCDNDIVNALQTHTDDYTQWQLALAYAWLFLIAVPAVGAAVGYLLGL